jgi:long-chain fatty acid transport protein
VARHFVVADRGDAVRIRAVAFGLSLCSFIVPARALAQGFGISEQGTCAMSRGGAAAGDPCDDGSAIYINPAGLAGREGLVISGGGTLIFASGSFTSDLMRRSAIDNDGVLAPHLYVQYGISDRAAFGFGLYAPYGLAMKWPLDFEGRFVNYDAKLETVYLQPTVAYAFNDRVSVGGGLTVAVSSVELNRREDLARVPIPGAAGLTFGALVNTQTDFASTSLEASGATGFGANLGILVRPHARVRVGLRYLTKIALDYDGDATFTPVPGPFAVTRPNPLGLPVGTPLDAAVSQVVASLQNQVLTTELEMPAQLQLGVSVQAASRVKLFADYQWVDWSAFDHVSLDFAMPIPPDEELVQNYQDTSGVRFGAEVELNAALRARGGYFYNQAASPDETVTPILPEASRNHVTLGLGWSPHQKVTIDAAYHFLKAADRRGRVVNPPAGELPTVALNSGTYEGRGDLFGITLTFRP